MIGNSAVEISEVPAAILALIYYQILIRWDDTHIAVVDKNVQFRPNLKSQLSSHYINKREARAMGFQDILLK